MTNNNNEYYLKRTRAAAKEIELGVAEEDRARKDITIEELFPLTVSIIGDVSYRINTEGKIPSGADLEKLIFASEFFTSYVQINSDESIKIKYLAIGAVAGYLCDRVGDASLLASRIVIDESISDYLFLTLVHILKNHSLVDIHFDRNTYFERELKSFITEYCLAKDEGRGVNKDISNALLRKVYDCGSDNELLITDIMVAVCNMKCMYSVAAMIKQTETISDIKKQLLIKNNAILSEFWPAQRLLLQKGFLDGKSGVIQLPTGAGKTKSISLCVFSFFSSQEKSISVVVSPFRALCRETANTLKRDLRFDESINVVELSDVMKEDYVLPGTEQIDKKYVVVVTPEKLLYVLRHEPDFAQFIGQMIFDEGHIFGDDSRGANYELLVASILEMLHEKPQLIMISAIVSGVSDINNWISEGKGCIISENSIATTKKYTASLSRRLSSGKRYLYLDYLNNSDLETIDFYVPRFIELKMYVDNGKEKYFPEDTRDASIATLIRLSRYANCALFTGKKDSVNAIARRIVEISDFLDTSPLSDRNDVKEQEKLVRLVIENYGEDSVYAEAAKIGVFLHHSGLSDGLKASVEYAMTEHRITNVICTSTLAQGVNLPIKYLIIDSIYQGNKAIGRQDFKNLIGRVGRSGMYTEGTVIYTDHSSYREKNWKWNKFVELYGESEDNCMSQLLWICGYYQSIDLMNIIKLYYISNKNNDNDILARIPGEENEKKEIWNHVKGILDNLESFMAQWDDVTEDNIMSLVSHTLLIQAAGEECGQRLKEVLGVINDYLEMRIPDKNLRRAYSKSLLSVEDYLKLKSFVDSFDAEEDFSSQEIHEMCIEQIYQLSNNATMKKVSLALVNKIASLWIQGVPYGEIFNQCSDERIAWGKRTRKIKLEDIVTICDGGFNYSATIILNAIFELLVQKGEDYDEIATIINDFLLQLKYGLPDKNSIYIYEEAFNDRNIALNICRDFSIKAVNKNDVIAEMKRKQERISDFLSDYPSYFQHRFETTICD